MTNKARFSIMMFLQYAIWGAWTTALGAHLEKIGFSGTEIAGMKSLETDFELLAADIALQETLELLEWSRLCLYLSRFASTSSGRRECQNLSLPENLATSRLRLAENASRAPSSASLSRLLLFVEPKVPLSLTSMASNIVSSLSSRYCLTKGVPIFAVTFQSIDLTSSPA